MPAQSKLPAPSIVLEWETVLEGGIDRVQRGLREMGRQIAELSPQMEGRSQIVVCYDPDVISPVQLTTLLERTVGCNGNWGGEFCLCPAGPEADYYEKKNVGARQSRNDILLFFDTDLVPEAGWLSGMLEPFADWKVSVVVGATHMDHGWTYDMAVALFWIFLPSQPALPLRPTKRLVSNNIAFRRKLFERFPFPRRPTHRGQCTELGLQLMGAGITMYEQTGARASHPPPPGLTGLVMRAWAAGKDDHFYDAQTQPASLTDLWQHILADFRMVARRIHERKPQLHPGYLERAVGWLLGWCYYTIKASAYINAMLKPRGRSEIRLADS